MDAMREGEIISVVNRNEDPKELKMNKAEKAYYDSLIREREEYKAEYGEYPMFELPMESYNNLW